MGVRHQSQEHKLTHTKTMLFNLAGLCLLVSVVTSQRSRFGSSQKAQMFDRMQKAAQDSYESTIPGAPGADYPTYSIPPPTSFSCGGLIQGYYADQETDCQVYHVCGAEEGRTAPISSLLCPNGTLYNQQYFVCDWWFNVDCSVARDFFYINEDIAKAAAEANSLRRTKKNIRLQDYQDYENNY